MSKGTKTRAASRVGDVPEELLESGRRMAGLGRDVWLAGLGALAVVGEESAHLFDRLVESGEELEKRGKKEIGARQRELAKALDEEVLDPVSAALKRFGVASRAEMDDVSTRVDRLTRRVERVLAHVAGEPTSDGAAERATLKVYKVVAESGGWVVSREGGGEPTVHATKDEALEAARARAKEHAPSRVEVFKKDGTLQDTHTF